MTTVDLCTTPNQYTRPSSRRLLDGAVELFGYQAFSVSADDLRIAPVDAALARKAALLDPLMQPSHLRGRSVLDLGANNGFFSFLALQRGAARATAVDLDPDCVANLRATRVHLGLDPLDVRLANAADWNEPAECVLALALSHWLGACTASLGSLEAVVGHLSELAQYVLILEFVEASDPAIQIFGHLTWQGAQVEGYSRASFEAALGTHFRRVQRLGDVSATRSLYAAFKPPLEIDLRVPFRLAAPRQRLIACRELTIVDGVGQWSAVFDLGDVIVKQTTGTLAAHEAQVLSRLQGPSTPRVLGTSMAEGSSTVTLEKMAGAPLREVRAELMADRRALVHFIGGCLDLLDELRRAEVSHRDIHEDNILVRDGLPVLIDFGWASAPGAEVDPPPAIRAWRLAMLEPGATREHCDVRAVGRMLAAVAGGAFPDLDALFGVMAEPDASRRIVDTAQLRAWLGRLDALAAQPQGPDAAWLHLLLLAEDRARRARQLHEALAAQVATLESETARLAAVMAEAVARAAEAAARTAADDARREVVAADERRVDLHARLHEALEGRRALGRLTDDEAHHVARLARALRARGGVEQVRAIASCVLDSLSPADRPWPMFAYLLASLDAGAHRIDLALTGFRRVIRKATGSDAAPFIAGAAFHVARLLVDRGQLRAARRYVRQCLALIPDHREARALAERLTPTRSTTRRGSSTGAPRA